MWFLFFFSVPLCLLHAFFDRVHTKTTEHTQATVDAEEALSASKLIIHALPVQASRQFIEMNAKFYPPDVPVLCTSKGVEVTSLKFMCELFPELVRPLLSLSLVSPPHLSILSISSLFRP